MHRSSTAPSVTSRTLPPGLSSYSPNIHWSYYVTNVTTLEQEGSSDVLDDEFDEFDDDFLPPTSVKESKKWIQRVPETILQLWPYTLPLMAYSSLESRRYGNTSFIMLFLSLRRQIESSWRKAEKAEKNRTSPIPPNKIFCYVFCNQTCLSRIGLFSHQRVCSKYGYNAFHIFVRKA
ncbi:hypothetical protein LOAG_02597 [Loa loa]|uniref:Uncharacterized protein n=1 Tax=Loa loa TaxID=7209 RepID=A0A1S0U6B3_LOALO|nr:hypothetical protein LOAG_02597 [Loa loa]EFO25896.1 hypothetical protein LOAG_02597 [Loa loa]